MAKTAETLLESFGESLSVEHRIPTTGPLDNVVGTLSLSTPSEWTDLLRRINITAQKRVETSRNEGVNVSADVLGSDPYIRAPATHAAIAAAETRLGISLPEDYKSFLLTSDGAGFSGTMSIPGMERVADLEWHDANEMGLGELRIELTDISDLTEEERTSIPPFDRLLRISDPDDDEIVCLVPPEFVVRAYETILLQRGDAIAKPRNAWMCVTCCFRSPSNSMLMMDLAFSLLFHGPRAIPSMTVCSDFSSQSYDGYGFVIPCTQATCIKHWDMKITQTPFFFIPLLFTGARMNQEA